MSMKEQQVQKGEEKTSSKNVEKSLRCSEESKKNNRK